VPQSKRHPARRPEKRPAKPGHRAPSGAPASSSRRPAPTTAVSPARRRLEIWSAGPLAVLHRMPSWIVPLILGVLLVAGLAVPSRWSALFLLPVALFLLWLLLLAWPVLTPRGRAMRLIVVLLVLAAMVARFLSVL
jgi:hypothetical protein